MKNDPVPSAEEQAFFAHIIDDPADVLRRLVFADWLEENGQAPRAEYIRARCALDGKRPEFGTYADAVEKLEACRYQVPEIELPPGFLFHQHQGERRDWWDDSEDTMEGGMPSLAYVDPGVIIEDECSRATLVHGLKTLVETTTIRGLTIVDWLPIYAEALSTSPAASAITRLDLRHLHKGNSACPAVVALCRSPMARTLIRLDLHYGVSNQATADALAAAPFDSLRRFEARQMYDPPEVSRRLMAAPWFGRLERLLTSVPPGTVGRLDLPHLHTLDIWSPAVGLVETFGRSAELPALRRLSFNGVHLRGERAASLVALRSPEIVELRMLNSEVRPSDLKVLLAAPWARRVEVFGASKSSSSAAFDKVIDKSPCAKTLRIRRVG